jgi:hypothetical protein
MDAFLFSLTSRSARNQRLGMVCFQDCRHQFPFYRTDSVHDFWGIRSSRLWMSDDSEKLHFQGMGITMYGGRTGIRSSKQHSFLLSHAKFGHTHTHIYMQLKGNILKNYTVKLIFNAQSHLGTFILPPPFPPSRTPHSSRSILSPLTHIAGPPTTHLSSTPAPKNLTPQMKKTRTRNATKGYGYGPEADCERLHCGRVRDQAGSLKGKQIARLMVGMVRRNVLFEQGMECNPNSFARWGGWIGKTVLKVYVNYQEERRDG